MKKFVLAVLGLSLIVPVVSFAGDKVFYNKTNKNLTVIISGLQCNSKLEQCTIVPGSQKTIPDDKQGHRMDYGTSLLVGQLQMKSVLGITLYNQEFVAPCPDGQGLCPIEPYSPINVVEGLDIFQVAPRMLVLNRHH